MSLSKGNTVITDCEKLITNHYKPECNYELAQYLFDTIKVAIKSITQNSSVRKDNLAKLIKKQFTEKLIKEYIRKMEKALVYEYEPEKKQMIIKVKDLLKLIDNHDRGGTGTTNKLNMMVGDINMDLQKLNQSNPSSISSRSLKHRRRVATALTSGLRKRARTKKKPTKKKPSQKKKSKPKNKKL